MGETVLFSHGVPGDLRTFLPAARLLSQGFRTVTFTHRYFGAAPFGDRPFGTESQALDLIDLAEAIGAGPIHIVAWSYSAHAALAVAIRRPELVASLSIYEPGFPTFVEDQAVLEQIATDQGAAFGPVFEHCQAGDLDLAVKASIDAAAGRDGCFSSLDARLKEIYLDSAQALPRLFSQTAPVSISRRDIDSVRVPISLAWGSETRTCYRLTSEALARSATMRSECMEGADHLWPDLHQADFAAWILKQINVSA